MIKATPKSGGPCWATRSCRDNPSSLDVRGMADHPEPVFVLILRGSRGLRVTWSKHAGAEGMVFTCDSWALDSVPLPRLKETQMLSRRAVTVVVQF